MFTKIGKSGGQVAWTYTSTTPETGETKAEVRATYYSGEIGETVYVEIDLTRPDGTTEHVERRGTLNVERAVITHKVFYASVSSLGGDVKGSGYYVKQAVEDYASKVVGEVVHQDEKARRAAQAAARPHVHDWHETKRDGEAYRICPCGTSERRAVDEEGETLVPGRIYRVVRGETAVFAAFVYAVVEDDDSLTLVFENPDGVREGFGESRTTVEAWSESDMAAAYGR